jgi:hypothetical protein
MNDVVRGLAGAGPGVGVVDGAAVLAGESAHEVPGSGFLLHRYDPPAADQELRLALPYDNAPVLCNWRKFE